MKRVSMTLVVGLILALGAGGLEAQQAAPAKKRPRKAKQVWANVDFPERPAEKAEKRIKPVTEEEKKAALEEKLKELGAQAARAQSDVDWQQSRREDLLREIKALEKQLNAAATQREQLAINTRIQGKRNQLKMVAAQAGMDRFKVQQIKYRQEELLAPHETVHCGVPLTPKEKAEQKKQRS